MRSSRGSPWPRDWTRVSCTADQLFTVCPGKALNLWWACQIPADLVEMQILVPPVGGAWESAFLTSSWGIPMGLVREPQAEGQEEWPSRMWMEFTGFSHNPQGLSVPSRTCTVCFKYRSSHGGNFTLFLPTRVPAAQHPGSFLQGKRQCPQTRTDESPVLGQAHSACVRLQGGSEPPPRQWGAPCTLRVPRAGFLVLEVLG